MCRGKSAEFHALNFRQGQLEICAVLLFSDHVRYMSSSIRRNRLSSACLSPVTFVHPTQAIKIFGNVSTPFGTFAISDLSVKILRRSSQGNPSVGGGGVKRKRGSQI